MKKIWIVEGGNGGSEYYEWRVAAYENEEQAKQHAELANEQSKINDKLSREEKIKLGKQYNKYDDNGSPYRQYGMPDYTYYFIEIFENPKQYGEGQKKRIKSYWKSPRTGNEINLRHIIGDNYKYFLESEKEEDIEDFFKAWEKYKKERGES